MTSFVYTWNAAFDAAPADTDTRSQGASQIRTTRAAIHERMSVDHVWGVGVTDGLHQAVTLPASTAWNNVGGSPVGSNRGQLFAQRATNGKGNVETELYWVSDRGIQTQLTQNGALVIPSIGMIMLLGQNTSAQGWIICNGASYSPSVYPGLFAVIGYTYGSSGANFLVPNLPAVGSSIFYWIYGGFGADA